MATNFATISSLGKIITDAITAGNATNIPARSIRKTLIKVTTGQYREVLPIIIPAECCIMGDELRSVNVQPRKSTNSTLTPKSDYRYSSKALERIEQVVGNVASGLAMTPTTGNTLTQTQPGTAATGTQETALDAKIDIITAAITAGNLNSLPAPVYPPIAWADAEYEVAHSNILSDKADVITSTIQFINTTYNTTFNYRWF